MLDGSRSHDTHTAVIRGRLVRVGFLVLGLTGLLLQRIIEFVDSREGAFLAPGPVHDGRAAASFG